jgi:hypothetical protein
MNVRQDRHALVGGDELGEQAIERLGIAAAQEHDRPRRVPGIELARDRGEGVAQRRGQDRPLPVARPAALLAGQPVEVGEVDDRAVPAALAHARDGGR